MKVVNKYIASFCLASLILLGAGCSSAKQDDSSVADGDSYISEEDEANETKISSKTRKSSSDKKSSDFSFANLFKSKFITIGESTVYAPQMFGGIKQTEADIIYYPKKDAAGFSASFKAVYYYLTLDDSARNSLIKAVDRYFSDFEEKKLSRSAKKTEKAYGKVNSEVFWGTLKGNSPNYGEGSLNLGYQFVEKSPYFTLTLYPVDNIPYSKGLVNDEKSLKLEYFFTKNQARMLADALMDENLEKKIREYEAVELGLVEDIDDYSYTSDSDYEEIEDDGVEEVDGDE